jgi:hypothetical protein
MELRPRNAILPSLAAVFLLLTGISLTSVPNFELLYSFEGPIAACQGDDCHLLYTVKIGNTGRAPQSQVELVFDRHALGELTLEPKARKFGKILKASELTEDDDELSIRVSDVKPGERIEVSFLVRADRLNVPQKQRMLRAVHPAVGRAERGDPDVVTFGRFLHGLISPFV